LKEEECINLGFIKYVNVNPSMPVSVQCTDLVSFHTLPASVQRTGTVFSTIKGYVLRFRMEERPPIQSVAVNIFNKQSRTADKRWSSSLGLGGGGLEGGLTTPHRKNEIFTQTCN